MNTHCHEELQECSPVDTGRKKKHSEKIKSDIKVRLNRIEGQIRGVKGLVEKNTYCDPILNQIAAIHAALNGVEKILLKNHIHDCVVDRIREGDSAVIDELLKTIQKMMK